MKGEELFRGMNEINDTLLLKAAPGAYVPARVVQKKRTPGQRSVGFRRTKRVALIAACLAVVLLMVPFGMLMAKISDSGDADMALGGRYAWKNDRPFKDGADLISAAEISALWKWEDRTVIEQYTMCDVNGTAFCSRQKTISAQYLGERLGEFEITGRDIISGELHTIKSDVYAIRGVSEEALLAVALDGHYVVFMKDSYAPPKTFSAWISTYALMKNLPLTQFFDSKGDCYSLTDAESDALWQKLMQWGDAPFVEYDTIGEAGLGDSLNFSVTSECLGVANKSFRVFSEGYLLTNFAEYAYMFAIGKSAAGELMEYARSHGEKTEAPVSEYLLPGVITEIGEDYIKINDASLMKGVSDGTEFTIMLHDLRLKRYFTNHILEVGQLIVVICPEKIGSDAAGNPVPVANASDIRRAEKGSDGSILIPE